MDISNSSSHCKEQRCISHYYLYHLLQPSPYLWCSTTAFPLDLNMSFFKLFFSNSIVLYTTFTHSHCFSFSPVVLTSACCTTFKIGHPCQLCTIAKLTAEHHKHTIYQQQKHQQGPCISSHSTFFCCPRILTVSLLCPCFTYCFTCSWNSISQHFPS